MQQVGDMFTGFHQKIHGSLITAILTMSICHVYLCEAGQSNVLNKKVGPVHLIMVYVVSVAIKIP